LRADATTLGRFAYTLNARGDRTQAHEILARAGGGQDEHTLVYGYDGAQRVTSAIRYPGSATSGTPQRSDSYTYDTASNRLSQAVALNGGAPTTTNYSYDDANRLSSAGFAYDNAGRMTSDGTNTYVWDRANRLLSMGGSSYAYDDVWQYPLIRKHVFHGCTEPRQDVAAIERLVGSQQPPRCQRQDFDQLAVGVEDPDHPRTMLEIVIRLVGHFFIRLVGRLNFDCQRRHERDDLIQRKGGLLRADERKIGNRGVIAAGNTVLHTENSLPYGAFLKIKADAKGECAHNNTVQRSATILFDDLSGDQFQLAFAVFRQFGNGEEFLAHHAHLFAIVHRVSPPSTSYYFTHNPPVPLTQTTELQ
jgi:hypothetical protein